MTGVSEPTFEQELAATLAARKELGPAHDKELIAGFLDRIEHELDAHIDERIAARDPGQAARRPSCTRGTSRSASRSSPSQAGSPAVARLIVTVIALDDRLRLRRDEPLVA